jgi:hypothetical protein
MRWDWLPAAMPGIAGLMADMRRRHGDAFVNSCWQKGVVERQPRFFFAREGPLAVGTPWPEIADVAGWQVTSTQAALFLADPASWVVPARAS